MWPSLQDYCNYCNYDCGLHVLLYIQMFEEMVISNIDKVNVEPYGFHVLFLSNSRTSDLCLNNVGKCVDVPKGAFYVPPLS